MSNKTEDQFPFNEQAIVASLFKKYTQGDITASEQEILMGLINQPAMQDMLKELIDNEMEAIYSNELPPELIQTDEKAAVILNRILSDNKKGINLAPVADTDITHQEANVKIKKSVSYSWIKYAAVILLLVTISVSFFAEKNKQKGPALASTPQKDILLNDIKAGGTKATLKLADGTIIILDTAMNGFISQEGNASVLKQKDGELIYNASNKVEGPTVYNTLTTPSGGIFQLRLPDGTKVWLNAASSIKYPTAFAGNERRVEVSGEAYFEVSHNPEKPFSVNISNRAIVEVLGTHFNVNSYDEEKEMKVTLLEGKIGFSPAGSAEFVNAQRKILKTGQQGRLLNSLLGRANGNELINVSNNIDLEEVMAWTKGEFRFKNMPIDYLLRQAARWYDVKIEYRIDPSDITLTGVITRKDNIDKFLEVITATRKVQFVAEGRKIIVEKYREK